MKLTDPSIWDGRTPHPNVVEANKRMQRIGENIKPLSQQVRRQIIEDIKVILELKK